MESLHVISPESQTCETNPQMSKIGPTATGYQYQQLAAAMAPKVKKAKTTKSPYKQMDDRAKAKNERKVRKQQRLKNKKK